MRMDSLWRRWTVKSDHFNLGHNWKGGDFEVREISIWFYFNWPYKFYEILQMSCALLKHSRVQNMAHNMLFSLYIPEPIYWRYQWSAPAVLMVACILYFRLMEINLTFLRVCPWHCPWIIKVKFRPEKAWLFWQS